MGAGPTAHPSPLSQPQGLLTPAMRRAQVRAGAEAAHLEVMEACAGPHGDFAGGVALVELEVAVYVQLLSGNAQETIRYDH